MISKHVQGNCGKCGEQLHHSTENRTCGNVGVCGLGAGAAGQARALWPDGALSQTASSRPRLGYSLGYCVTVSVTQWNHVEQTWADPNIERFMFVRWSLKVPVGQDTLLWQAAPPRTEVCFNF